MLRITVEMVPHGDESLKRVLCQGEIFNTGKGTPSNGHYRFWLSQNGRPTVRWKKGMVSNFPRKQRGPWDLLFRALAKIVGERNG